MILKYIKQLSSIDAQRLREARKKISILEKLKDAEYLCKEAGSYKWYDTSKPNTPILKPLEMKLGEFEVPQFELVKGNYEYGFRRTSKLDNTENKNLSLIMGQANNWPGVTLSIEEYGYPYFLLGPFTLAKNDLYKKKNGVVCEIACFFHNRRKIYKAIYNLFISNKEKFIKELLEEAFLEDISSLFSVMEEEENILDFSFSDISLQKHIFSNKQKENNSLLIQQSMLYPPGRTGSDWFNPDVKSNIFLNENNQLVIDSFMTSGDSSWEHGNILEVNKDKNFQDFINNQINELLKQTVSMSNFGMKVYEKIESRLLLENI